MMWQSYELFLKRHSFYRIFFINTHQRQVIIGLGSGTVLLHGFLQHVDDLTGVETRCVGHQFQESLIAKEFFLLVLSLVQAVGVDQQLTTTDIVDALAFEGIILPEAERLVSYCMSRN